MIRKHGDAMGRNVFQAKTNLNHRIEGGSILKYRGQLQGVNTSIVRKASD